MDVAALALVVGVFVLSLGLMPEDEINFTVRFTGLLLGALTGAWLLYSLLLGIAISTGLLPAHVV